MRTQFLILTLKLWLTYAESTKGNIYECISECSYVCMPLFSLFPWVEYPCPLPSLPASDFSSYCKALLLNQNLVQTPSLSTFLIHLRKCPLLYLPRKQLSHLGSTTSNTTSISSVQFSHSVMSDSATPWITAHQASLSITNSWSSPRLTSIESVMPSSHLILCRPLLLPPIPPSIRVFFNESTLCMAKVLEFQL